MIGTMVRELSDGEELAMESVAVSAFIDDPRERTLEGGPARSELAKETR